MPFERFRTISLNNFIERNPQSWDILGNDSSKSYVDSFLTEAESYLEECLASKYEEYPRVEYVGKVPLPRLCAHGKTMAQLQMKTNSISIQCVQDLFDMAWRREGNNFYKVAIDCCHTNALRLNPKQFKPNRQQRKLLNHLADYLQYGGVVSNKTKNKKASSDNFTLEAYVNKLFANNDAHKFEIRLTRPGSKLSHETYEEVFALFQKYQAVVHKNSYGREDFDRVVNNTPINMFGNEQHSELFGTFHRQYLIDGIIVGVEMFDILPNYLIAQTSFYDPDLSHLNLGTLMMLEPILFTQKLSETLGRQIYYSTGLYNHCNKKHHYKLLFADEILCADTPNWTPLTKEVVEMLEKSELIHSENFPTLLAMPRTSSILCSYNGKVREYGPLKEILSRKEREVARQKLAEFVQETGHVAKDLIVVLE